MDKARQTGKYIHCTRSMDLYKSFIPNPLPPKPPIRFDVELSILMDKANRDLGKLDGITSLLPNPSLFTSFYIMKEALLSSQIEGTQSTFSELLLFAKEKPSNIPSDTQEVWNYINAFNYGIRVIKDSPERKITLQLLVEMHNILLSDSRTNNESIGRFRDIQNWIGGDRPSRAKFVPPPPEQVLPCLQDLERFLNNIPEKTPVIMKVALGHVQFETIHPFADGNGRIGRLLIVLLLCMEEALSEPMLYLSLYFKTNYAEYVEKLQKVREEGDWEGWLKFFFEGISEVSRQSIEAAQSILSLIEDSRSRIAQFPQPKTLNEIHSYLLKHPIVSIKELSKELRISIPSVTTGLQRLQKIGVVEETTGYSRNRLFVYRRYLSILSEGTKPVRIKRN